MIDLMLGLLAAAASQPAVIRPLPSPIIMTPAPRAPALRAEIAVPVTRATTNLPRLFSTDDYPQAALRNQEKGTVAFIVDVSRDGRVTNCTVTTSSNSASLDSTTCRIVQSRARYTPARDANGRPVEDRVSGRIRWDLPPTLPIPFADLKFALVFTTKEGVVTKCRTEGGAKQASGAPCSSMMAIGQKLVADGRTQNLLKTGEILLEQGILVGGPDAASGVGRGRGETLVMLTALAFDIDADGNISRCVAAVGNMNAERAVALCKDSAKAKFVPLDAVASDRLDRHAVRYMATYTRPGS